MALTAGTRLGSYEVTALIGKGGMGEVCQARDTTPVPGAARQLRRRLLDGT